MTDRLATAAAVREYSRNRGVRLEGDEADKFNLVGTKPTEKAEFSEDKTYVILGVSPSEFIDRHGAAEFNMSDLADMFKKICRDYGKNLLRDERSHAVEFCSKMIYEVGPMARRVKKADGDKVWRFRFAYNDNNRLVTKRAFVCTFKANENLHVPDSDNKITLTIKQATLLAIGTFNKINGISCTYVPSKYIFTMSFQFSGLPTYCIVTGASQGIGSKIAIEFSKKFAKGSLILLLARSLSGLVETKNLILKENPDICVVTQSVDLSKASADTFSSIIQKSLNDTDLDPSTFGLSVLVHNAGSVGDLKEFCADMSDSFKIQEYFSLNLFSVMCLTSVFLKNFSENVVKNRLIINITSLCAVKPFRNLGYYCTGKAAREMYFKVLAEEDSSLRVLSYSPGPVNTDMISQIMSDVKDPDTKTMFLDMKKNDSILSTEQTVNRLVSILLKNKFESGCRIDYFDIDD